MKRFIIITVLACCFLISNTSCDKIGDDQSEGENGERPISPGVKEYTISSEIHIQDSISVQ